MSLFRRSSARSLEFRAVGIAVGVGMDHGTRQRPASSGPAGVGCTTCGDRGRVDMIDMTVRRAYLTCRGCERTWDTDRDRVPRHAFLSAAQ